MRSMLAYRLIERKRDGERIEPGEWRALLAAHAAGLATDEQVAALLMAIYLRGLDDDETGALTEAMVQSGARLRRGRQGVPRIDKHSTGGVGDKVSLVLGPLIASLGVVVPMMAGRALGHTGGTVDKLEAIPGFRTALSLHDAERQLDGIGCLLMGQSAAMAPADERLYAIRCETATVESMPLIAASIMSKKLAESLDGLVIDLKHGAGAFLPDLDRGMALVRLMTAIGSVHGCRVSALVTAMDRPLGRACGNALEVEEAIHALHGEGPPDLMTVTYALGAEMLALAGVTSSPEDAMERMKRAIASGAAADMLRAVIEAQGGNPSVVEDPSILPQAEACELYVAPRRGIVSRVDPRAVGRGVIALGGGRTRRTDRIDPTVGFVISVKPGDWVESGEPLATVFARDADGIAAGRAALAEAIGIADQAVPSLPLVAPYTDTTGDTVRQPRAAMRRARSRVVRGRAEPGDVSP